ncbi:MAG: ABC transporter substrate-binding protein [Spirochaetaceae bacterium]|jgi:ribose transport system substrate-binding protein|nr:ABC transporter substrate-binding protein [Spirochaetaceae bacterium]
MKKSLLLFVTILLMLSMGTSLFAAGKQEAKDDEIKILFMPGVADPFYYMMEKGIRAKGEELGATIVVAEFPKSWGPEAQVPILEATIAQGGFDMVLIAPTAVDALIAPLKKLYDQGIEIITVDTYLGNGDYATASDFSFPLSYIGSDNEKGGREIAQEMGKLTGEKGKVYVNTTNPDVSSVAGRVKGFQEGITQYPGMELVGVDYNMDVQQKATDQTLAALQKDPDIAGIFATNVFSSQGAYQAIVNAGLTGAIKLATWDATVDMIAALKKGQVDLVLAQKPYEIGSLAVEWGYKFLTDGTEIPKKVIPGFVFFTQANVNDPKLDEFIYK